ncbi:PorT family protein [Dokdonia sp. Dokd-P16]|uniref:porin family protein n=1 Tax=Dokdonia sp. Dokd-P16 TaxID=2173169 RepID=UPI000D549BB1|nr:porin family protein [Dokdonia sp. Dokd-P16]AWH74616.1 PorT family protein [Dokdonia sp. Dokd-P16]
MKKIVVVAIAALFGTVAVQAQDEVSFGAKGGVNFATVGGDDFDDPDARTSFHFGGFVEVPITEKFSIQPEVYYSGQGYDIQSVNNGDDVEFQLDYINVPVLAKYYFVDGFYGEVGPQIGFNVNSEIDSNPDGNSGDINFNNDAINTIDFAVVGGLGYKLNNGLFFNARYNLGLSDVFSSEDLGGFDLDARNRVFMLGAGFAF